MSSYSRLVSDVGSYYDRDDLENVAPTFITAAEELIHAAPGDGGLRVRAMTVRASLDGDGTRFVALPDDYLDLRRLEWASGDPQSQLIQRSPEGLTSFRDTRPSGSKPSSYCIVDAIEFDVALESATGLLDITYWGKFPALTSSNETNWLVTNAYGVYLYATLMQAATYLRDPEGATIWDAAFKRHTSALTSRDAASRVGGAPRVVVEGAELLP